MLTTTLIIGATGQLGSKLIQKRTDFLSNSKVKAFVRKASSYQHLCCDIDDLVFGDLTDKQSLIRACSGVNTVIATATVVFPLGNCSFENDERNGYKNLVEACEICGVTQIVFISVPFNPQFIKRSKTYEMKIWCEDLLMGSTIKYTILRCSPFMDDYFALIGSEIPLKGEKLATLNRSSGLSKAFRSLVRNSIESIGLAWVPGSANNRHAFISVEDVANYCVKVSNNPDFYNCILTLGGKENLSWNDICSIYSELLSRKVRPIQIPATLLLSLATITKLFSETLSNQLSILWILAITETLRDASLDDKIPYEDMLTAKRYLTEKMRCLS